MDNRYYYSQAKCSMNFNGKNFNSDMSENNSSNTQNTNDSASQMESDKMQPQTQLSQKKQSIPSPSTSLSSSRSLPLPPPPEPSYLREMTRESVENTSIGSTQQESKVETNKPSASSIMVSEEDKELEERLKRISIETEESKSSAWVKEPFVLNSQNQTEIAETISCDSHLSDYSSQNKYTEYYDPSNRKTAVEDDENSLTNISSINKPFKSTENPKVSATKRFTFNTADTNNYNQFSTISSSHSQENILSDKESDNKISDSQLVIKPLPLLEKKFMQPNNEDNFSSQQSIQINDDLISNQHQHSEIDNITQSESHNRSTLTFESSLNNSNRTVFRQFCNSRSGNFVPSTGYSSGEVIIEKKNEQKLIDQNKNKIMSPSHNKVHVPVTQGVNNQYMFENLSTIETASTVTTVKENPKYKKNNDNDNETDATFSMDFQKTELTHSKVQNSNKPKNEKKTEEIYYKDTSFRLSDQLDDRSLSSESTLGTSTVSSNHDYTNKSSTGSKQSTNSKTSHLVKQRVVYTDNKSSVSTIKTSSTNQIPDDIMMPGKMDLHASDSTLDTITFTDKNSQFSYVYSDKNLNDEILNLGEEVEKNQSKHKYVDDIIILNDEIGVYWSEYLLKNKNYLDEMIEYIEEFIKVIHIKGLISHVGSVVKITYKVKEKDVIMIKIQIIHFILDYIKNMFKCFIIFKPSDDEKIQYFHKYESFCKLFRNYLSSVTDHNRNLNIINSNKMTCYGKIDDLKSLSNKVTGAVKVDSKYKKYLFLNKHWMKYYDILMKKNLLIFDFKDNENLCYLKGSAYRVAYATAVIVFITNESTCTTFKNVVIQDENKKEINDELEKIQCVFDFETSELISPNEDSKTEAKKILTKFAIAKCETIELTLKDYEVEVILLLNNFKLFNNFCKFLKSLIPSFVKCKKDTNSSSILIISHVTKRFHEQKHVYIKDIKAYFDMNINRIFINVTYWPISTKCPSEYINIFLPKIKEMMPNFYFKIDDNHRISVWGAENTAIELSETVDPIDFEVPSYEFLKTSVIWKDWLKEFLRVGNNISLLSLYNFDKLKFSGKFWDTRFLYTIGEHIIKNIISKDYNHLKCDKAFELAIPILVNEFNQIPNFYFDSRNLIIYSNDSKYIQSFDNKVNDLLNSYAPYVLEFNEKYINYLLGPGNRFLEPVKNYIKEITKTSVILNTFGFIRDKFFDSCRDFIRVEARFEYPDVYLQFLLDTLIERPELKTVYTEIVQNSLILYGDRKDVRVAAAFINPYCEELDDKNRKYLKSGQELKRKHFVI